MLAMLTAGSMGFTACSSDDVVDGGNTNNGVAGKMVKTSFALNIPYGNKSGRMTADNTQANGEASTFLGMKDMRLLAFDKDNVSLATNSTKKIVLGGTDDAFETNENRRIYRDVTIPVGTKNFLFYGKAFDVVTDRFANGSILDSQELSKGANNSDAGDVIDLNNVTFSLEQIKNGSFNSDVQAKAVAQALHDVYNANYDETVTNTVEGGTSTTTTENRTWSYFKDYTGSDVKKKHAATLFAQFSKMQAGSAASVKTALDYLINSCGASAPAGAPSNILEAIVMAANKAKSDLTTITFPENLNLPDGAARGSFASDGTFTFANPANVAMGGNGLDYTKVTYPAALNYYVETEVGANDNLISSLTDTQWPTYTNWKNNNYNWGDDWKAEVGNNTRTIALKKAIQYAVASLETTVGIKSGVTDFTDNAKSVGKLLEDQTVPVGAGFELTGVLVGGQPTIVGYDYTPKTALKTTTNTENSTTTTSYSGDYTYTVYDKEINPKEGSHVVNAGSTVTNYTLVLDNSKYEGDPSDIFVTIELKNNTGVDFYGIDGLVPNGGKFYLVANVKYNNGNYNVAGKEKPKSVFTKDFKTKLNLSLGANALKSAYNTIPDLRSTQISLGLAVDLTWEDGITFDVEL